MNLLIAAVLGCCSPLVGWAGVGAQFSEPDSQVQGYPETKLPRYPLRIGNRLATAAEYRMHLERHGFKRSTLDGMSVWQCMQLFDDWTVGTVRYELLK